MFHSGLDTPLNYLKGIGDHRAKLLKAELGIATFGDLLEYLPFRYVDRSQVHSIAEIAPDNVSYIQIRATVLAVNQTGIGRKSRLVVDVADDSSMAQMVWFSAPSSISRMLVVGQQYIFFGKASWFDGQLSIVHPEIERTGENQQSQRAQVQGVYSTTERLTQVGLNPKAIARAVASAFESVPWASIAETLPSYLIEMMELMTRGEALYQAHFPSDNQSLNRAIFRLKFEELLTLQLNQLQRKQIRHLSSQGNTFGVVGEKFNKFYKENLPFPLTGAQKRVIREIRGDMGSGHQMNRLLQGDVGSGKTIVALLCTLIAIDNGFQAAIMAPTEILSRQHYASILELSEGLGINVRILTGTTRAKERREILQQLIDGEINLLIGTHALIEDPVEFKKLGFVVIDEQHRFGVQQRAKLWAKSPVPPHILVMTATPIPRTLAMTIYGDLDVSVIDELPPGRKPIETYAFKESQRLQVVGFMRKQIELGRQIYVVYPLIKESEKLDYANLEIGAQNIEEFFPHPQYSNVVVHGKLPAEQKEYGMKMFKDGAAQILISTTVIEVGVNVPNATVMIIESAERFGLSQLHQLRGRVGRGSDQSYCILMSGDKISTDSRKRLDAMCETTDGFRLAQLDMEIRGAGDIEGTRQSGQAIELKLASLSRDTQILDVAAIQAEKILENDPHLSHPLNQKLKELVGKFKNKEELEDYSQIS